MRPRDYYDYLVKTLPEGRQRVVMQVLLNHIGAENFIWKLPEEDPDKPPRVNLMEKCERQGAHFSDERGLRLSIVELRKKGIPVCSSSGDGGYFLAGTLEEYREFRGREYVKKIVDMRETVTLMDEHVKKMFPDDYARYQREKSERAGQPALI